jgi:hypothetical protein
MTPADKAKAKKLFAMLQSSNENEVLVATRRLKDLLGKYGMTISDLVAGKVDWDAAPPKKAKAQKSSSPPLPTPPPPSISQQQRARYKKQTQAPTPRLIFALDATASRQPTWDQAAELQMEMFRAAGTGIDVKLVYYRGLECKASPWVRNQETLLTLMRKISCITGYTQIGRVLSHALKETESSPVRALVFVGDAFEESRRAMREPAAMLGQKGTPVFMFQEGEDYSTAKAFKEIADLSGGLYAAFDGGASARLKEQLKTILRTVGQFATAGGDAKLAIAQARESLSRALTLR